MNTNDLNQLEKVASGKLEGTLADHPELRSTLRNLGYEFNGSMPMDDLKVIAKIELNKR